MRRVFLAVSVLVAGLAVGGDDAVQAAAWLQNPYSLSFHLDNDLFTQTDRYYTNGVRLSLLSKDIEAMRLPAWAERVYDWFPMFGRPGYTNNIGLSIGQNMYTPRDITIAAPQPDDHPWGGWLYLGLSLHHKSLRDLHKLELQVGVVGPPSLAEDSQTFIHRVRHFDLPKGWDNQLGTEPGLLLSYTYKRRLATWGETRGFGMDLIPDVGACLGNIRIDASVGATVRAGWCVPQDFQSLRIDESGYAVAQKDELAGGWRSFSLYGFAGLRGYAVAHDIFLDGNTFRDSPSVDRRPLVGAAEVGFGVRWGPFRMVYAQVMRTEEFEGQDGGQQFGSVNVTWFF
jgi:hypothetical protein